MCDDHNNNNQASKQKTYLLYYSFWIVRNQRKSNEKIKKERLIVVWLRSIIIIIIIIMLHLHSLNLNNGKTLYTESGIESKEWLCVRCLQALYMQSILTFDDDGKNLETCSLLFHWLWWWWWWWWPDALLASSGRTTKLKKHWLIEKFFKLN